MTSAWHESRFTGLFSDFQPVPPRPHDPHVFIYAGVAPPMESLHSAPLHVGGCDWSEAGAANACIGEAIERLFAFPTKQDATIEASYKCWPLSEPAVPPEQWALFHPQQYACDGFPFEQLTRQTNLAWVCFRDVLSGEPHWIPEEFAYLFPRKGSRHRFCPATSTGLAAGTTDHPVTLRALQEVIERDALLGAWWGNYSIEEFDCSIAESAVDFSRLTRPNLRWRFYRINSPFSHHVTVVTLGGDDWEGFCFSIGSACRETRRASWMKSMLEAIQGRHYVRHLRRQEGDKPTGKPLRTFADHAVYYSYHSDKLETTVLATAKGMKDESPFAHETLPLLCQRLARPVLIRNLTPPTMIAQAMDWRVVKVVVPGLTPLHGDDRFAHLGGRLWLPRDVSDWNDMPPHPFP